MGIVVSILLMLLGLLAAEAAIAPKAPPAFNNLLAKLRPYQEPMGIAGILLGLLSLLEWISWLSRMNYAPVRMLLALAVVLLTVGLGIIFGFDAIRRNLKDSASPFFLKVDEFRTKILPYKEIMGYAGIVLGLLNFLAHL